MGNSIRMIVLSSLFFLFGCIITPQIVVHLKSLAIISGSHFAPFGKEGQIIKTVYLSVSGATAHSRCLDAGNMFFERNLVFYISPHLATVRLCIHNSNLAACTGTTRVRNVPLTCGSAFL